MKVYQRIGKMILIKISILTILSCSNSKLRSQSTKSSEHVKDEMKSEVHVQERILAYSSSNQYLGNDLMLANSGISSFKPPSESVLLLIKDSLGVEARDFVLQLSYLSGLFKSAIPIDDKLDNIKASVEFFSPSRDYVINTSKLNLLGSFWKDIREANNILYETYIKPIEGKSSLTISYSNFKTDLNKLLNVPEIKTIIDGYVYNTPSTEQEKFIYKVKAIHTDRLSNLCEKHESFIQRVVNDFDDSKEYVLIKYPKIKKYIIH